MVFKKIKKKLVMAQVKKLLKELNKMEKSLEKHIEEHPEVLEDEEFVNDYNELKQIIKEAKEYGEKFVRKEDVDFEEYVEFVHKFAEVAEKLGAKYNKDVAEKAKLLKSVRIDNTQGTFDASELDEEELKRLAEELKKKNL